MGVTMPPPRLAPSYHCIGAGADHRVFLFAPPSGARLRYCVDCDNLESGAWYGVGARDPLVLGPLAAGNHSLRVEAYRSDDDGVTL